MHFVNIIKLTLLICLYSLFGINFCFANSYIDNSLPRTADLGFRTAIEDQQLIIKRVNKDSEAAKIGVAEGDIIESFGTGPIAGLTAESLLSAQAQLNKWPAKKSLTLSLNRESGKTELTFIPKPKALEQIPAVDSDYSSVQTSEGDRLRTIVATPKDGKTIKRPAIFFVQWVSCGSIEYNPKSPSRQIFAELIQQTDRALLRVERSSDGDSRGPACHQLDYNTELSHYYQAYLALRNHPQVDPDKIIIYGSSLGSTMAPLLAERLIDKGIPVQGVMIQGGGGVTHLERMLAFERIYLERRPEVKPADIHQQIIDRIQFQVEYLAKGRHPNEIAKDSKAMKDIRNDILGMDQYTHYGRPFAWHQQAAQHNFLQAWHKIESPVLVVFNQFDQFETRHGHQLITQMVNRWRANSATYIEQPKMGHGNYQYPSAEAAYQFAEGKKAIDQLVTHFVSWIKRIK